MLEGKVLLKRTVVFSPDKKDNIAIEIKYIAEELSDNGEGYYSVGNKNQGTIICDSLDVAYKIYDMLIEDFTKVLAKIRE
jgi:hypothetical protein